MDNALQKKIADHYRAEYAQKALEKPKGLWSRLSRWNQKVFKKLRELDDKSNTDAASGLFIISPLLAGSIVAAVTGVGAFVAAGAVALAAYMGATAKASFSVRRAVNQSLEKDIKSGFLVARYKKEVVDAKLQKLQQSEPSLKGLAAVLALRSDDPELSAIAGDVKIRLDHIQGLRAESQLLFKTLCPAFSKATDRAAQQIMADRARMLKVERPQPPKP